VIYKGIFGKIPEFLGAKCGQPATLLARPACSWVLFDSVFSRCILFIESSTFVSWNGTNSKEKRGSLPLNPSTHLLLPHFSSKALVHPLPYHGSLKCSIPCYRRKENPTIKGGTTHQGHVVFFDCIDRRREDP
jgi:hypothetical protein